MKRILIIVILLAIVISGFFMSLVPTSDTVKKPIIAEQQRINKAGTKSAKPHTDLSKAVQIPVEIPHSTNTSITKKENSQLDMPVISDNPAAQLSNLPQEMQAEIKKLSGRYNKNVQPIEVEPGVFMMPPNKTILVVPVAVINEDGTVSTYEY